MATAGTYGTVTANKDNSSVTKRVSLRSSDYRQPEFESEFNRASQAAQAGVGPKVLGFELDVSRGLGKIRFEALECTLLQYLTAQDPEGPEWCSAVHQLLHKLVFDAGLVQFDCKGDNIMWGKDRFWVVDYGVWVEPVVPGSETESILAMLITLCVTLREQARQHIALQFFSAQLWQYIQRLLGDGDGDEQRTSLREFLLSSPNVRSILACYTGEQDEDVVIERVLYTFGLFH